MAFINNLLFGIILKEVLKELICYHIIKLAKKQARSKIALDKK